MDIKISISGAPETQFLEIERLQSVLKVVEKKNATAKTCERVRKKAINSLRTVVEGCISPVAKYMRSQPRSSLVGLNIKSMDKDCFPVDGFVKVAKIVILLDGKKPLALRHSPSSQSHWFPLVSDKLFALLYEVQQIFYILRFAAFEGKLFLLQQFQMQDINEISTNHRNVLFRMATIFPSAKSTDYLDAYCSQCEMASIICSLPLPKDMTLSYKINTKEKPKLSVKPICSVNCFTDSWAVEAESTCNFCAPLSISLRQPLHYRVIAVTIVFRFSHITHKTQNHYPNALNCIRFLAVTAGNAGIKISGSKFCKTELGNIRSEVFKQTKVTCNAMPPVVVSYCFILKSGRGH
uniref:Uncharacterized protein n=1 Tax=Glossina austeni TaxID=7395 RepID=A0A1A9VUW8_GLOAU